jgi:hypothetical protein
VTDSDAESTREEIPSNDLTRFPEVKPRAARKELGRIAMAEVAEEELNRLLIKVRQRPAN